MPRTATKPKSKSGVATTQIVKIEMMPAYRYQQPDHRSFQQSTKASDAADKEKAVRPILQNFRMA